MTVHIFVNKVLQYFGSQSRFFSLMLPVGIDFKKLEIESSNVHISPMHHYSK